MSKHCDICLLDLKNEHEMQVHLVSKKHLRMIQNIDTEEKSIYISPLPKFVSKYKLLKFFPQFGTIKRHRFGANYLIIEFNNRETTDYLLSTPIWLSDIKLDIRRTVRTDTKKPKTVKHENNEENVDPITYDKIENVLTENSTFDTQLNVFLRTIQLSDSEIDAKYGSICMELDQIFKIVFPKCKNHKFGSIQTGLGFKGCDLDIYMDIGEPIHELKNNLPNSWTMSGIFKQVKGIMYRMHSVFANIVPIRRARTPIIKFCYVPTNVSCDISFKNSLGIYNSHLIKYCVSLDDRLKPLIMLIKYWARHFRISGSGKISNYALILIIIFYLQQPAVNILPPLLEFQQTCQPQTVNGWQVNFNKNTMPISLKNTQTIPQLLHGFFHFYATFEFESQIICPLDGKIHVKSELKKIETLPTSMERYKDHLNISDTDNELNVSRPMCVQDPIELNHNVTASTSHFMLDSFVTYCTVGAEICATTSKNDYKNLVVMLFTTPVEKKKNEDKCIVTIRAKHFHYFSSENIPGTSAGIIEKSKFTKENWHLNIFNIVKDIFEKVLKVDVEIITTDTETDQQKIKILLDVHIRDHKKVALHCTGNKQVWRDRKIHSRTLDPMLNRLEREALISDHVIQKYKQDNTSNNVKLDFTCTFEFKTDPLKAVLTFADRNCNNHLFDVFTKFAKQKICEIIDPTLLHMKQFCDLY